MNKFKKSLFLISLLCIALAFTACSNPEGKGTNEEGVMATVNGKAIMQEEYDDALAYYKDYVEYQFGEGSWETEATRGLTYKELYEEYIMEEMTKSLLLLDAAEKEGITVTEEEKEHALDNFKINFANDEEYKSFMEQRGMTEEFILQELTKELLVNNYVVSKIDSLKPNDDDLKTIFDDMKMDTQVRASHILVETEEEAIEIIERINKGEDFGELAKELSIDTGSGVNGGDLDYFNYPQMVESFSEAAYALEIGEVSQPVQSDYGYHIIKLTDKVVDEDITVETKKAELNEYYKTYKYQDLLEELKSTAVIVKD
jgi:foldase protein PrsA